MPRHPDAKTDAMCCRCTAWLPMHSGSCTHGSCDHDDAVYVNGAGERLRFTTFRLDACDRWEALHND